MRYFLAICSVSCLWLTSCTNNSNTSSTQKEETKAPQLPPQSKLDDTGTQKLLSVVNSYYNLKDALVVTDAAKADEGAGKLIAAANELDAYIKTDSVNRTAIQPYLDTIKDGSNTLLATEDKTTEKKRISFEKVSDAVYNLLKIADVKNAKVYRQYCPMAFNDKGAYWLSNENEIKNPYFGKKMLECGEVTDSL